MVVEASKRYSLLKEYDRFICKAVYSGGNIESFMVYNDFIMKMYNEDSFATESLLKYSGLEEEELGKVIGFCNGNISVSSCRDILSRFFHVLISNKNMLNHMLYFKRDNDICLYLLDDVPRNIKDRLIELNIATATELAKFVMTSKMKPYGISPRSMFNLFDAIKKANPDYDVAYLKQCYEYTTERAEADKGLPNIDFYAGISMEDLYILYTICKRIDIYNLNDAIAITHAFRRYVEPELVDKLLNCFGSSIPSDIKQFTRSMLMLDNYLSDKKGMRLSQFESLIVRSAYYVSKILDKARIREILVEVEYGSEKLNVESLIPQKQTIINERIHNGTVFEFQEYIRKNGRVPVDINMGELLNLYNGFEGDMKKYVKWYKTYMKNKDGYPAYVLS